MISVIKVVEWPSQAATAATRWLVKQACWLPCPALGYSTFSKRFRKQKKDPKNDSFCVFCQRNLCYFLGFHQKTIYHNQIFDPKLRCIYFPWNLEVDRPRSSETDHTLWVFALRTFSLYWSAVAWLPTPKKWGGKIFLLVVEPTHLKHICARQNGWKSSPIFWGEKKKYVSCHQLVLVFITGYQVPGSLLLHCIIIEISLMILI